MLYQALFIPFRCKQKIVINLCFFYPFFYIFFISAVLRVYRTPGLPFGFYVNASLCRCYEHLTEPSWKMLAFSDPELYKAKNPGRPDRPTFFEKKVGIRQRRIHPWRKKILTYSSPPSTRGWGIFFLLYSKTKLHLIIKTDKNVCPTNWTHW